MHTMVPKPIGISPATLHSLANVAHDAKERPGMMSKYRKSRAFSPEGFFECEGRGLQWLGEASSKGGPRVVDVYDWGKDYLDIERVNACGPTLQAAHDLVRPSPTCTMLALIISDRSGRLYGNLLFRPPAGSGSYGYRRMDDVATYLAEGRLRPMVRLV